MLSLFRFFCWVGLSLSLVLEGTINETLNFAKRHQEFKNILFKEHEQEFIRLVKEKQSSQILFIGCSDLRVIPDLLLDTVPEDLFVIRTVGNFIPPYSASNWGDGVSATIQYAIEVLNIQHIIICGHSHCGAISGLFTNLDNKLNILKKWLRFGEKAKEITLKTVQPRVSLEEILPIAEQISVVYQLQHLLTFPFIKNRVDNGTLNLHAWYNKIETGEIEYYDPAAYRFKSLQTLVGNRLSTSKK